MTGDEEGAASDQQDNTARTIPEPSERFRDGNFLPFISAISISINIALIIIVVSVVERTKGIGDLLKEYQETLIGIPTIAVAAWAAAKLVDQIRIMNSSNRTAFQALNVAAKNQELEEARFRRERNADRVAFLNIVDDLPKAVMKARDEILARNGEATEQAAFGAIFREFRRLGILVLDQGERQTDEWGLFQWIIGAVEILTPDASYQRAEHERHTGGLSKYFADTFFDLNNYYLPRLKDKVFESYQLHRFRFHY